MKKLIVLGAFLFAPLMTLATVEVQPASVTTLGEDQTLSYNFGTQFVNSRSYVDFTLTAKGPDATVIRKFWVRGISYDASTNCPETIEVGNKCTIRVYFWPTSEGAHWGDVGLNLNDGNIYIRLFGNAVR